MQPRLIITRANGKCAIDTNAEEDKAIMITVVPAMPHNAFVTVGALNKALERYLKEEYKGPAAPKEQGATPGTVAAWEKALADKDAEIARLKYQITGYHEAIEVLRESKDKEITRRNEIIRRTAHCHGELQREMFKQRDRIAQQDQELKDLGQEIERRGKKIAELWLGSAWDNKPTKEPAQPVPSDTGMAKDIGDLILRVDKLEQAFCNCPVKEFPDFDKRIKECEERTRSYPARNTWILQLEEHERKFNQYETALKSLKEEVAAIPRPPKDRENYYEIDLGPGFQKIYISKNSVYPVPDQDAGGKKE